MSTWFYCLFKCFAKKVIANELPHYKIGKFLFSLKGEYMGTHDEESIEEVNTQDISPDEILCCCCIFCKSLLRE
jgi:hypothetical protein